LDLFASLLGGLGLFLVGIRAVGTHLQQLAGPRMRAVMAAATRGPVSTSLAGLMLGGLTQSSNAVTFIATSLISAGLLRMRAALPMLAFANVGTAGLVLLATVDLRLIVLWLAALVGVLTAFGLDRSGRARPALGALLGLALLFLGLDLMKAGAGPISAMPEVQAGAAAIAGSPVLVFLLATLVTVPVQSSSTVTILALSLHNVGLLSFEGAVVATLGASFGSGLAVVAMGGGLRGSARRLPLYQLLLRAGGAALAGLLFLLERWLGWPLLLAPLQWLADDADDRIGLLFLALQLVTAVVSVPFAGAAERLLARLCPETEAEAASRPRYLYDQALADPATALELVEREEARLLARLPPLLDPLREDAEPSLPRAELLSANAAVERSAARFLAELRQRAGERALLDRAVALDARLALLGGLRETLGEFGDTVEAGLREPALAPMLARLVEALHLLLTQLAEAAEGGAEDAAMLRALTEDRNDMMAGIRRRVARSSPELTGAAHSLLFRATAQFERAVWLIRRMTPAAGTARGLKPPGLPEGRIALS
jgi:phosphate:Na+ symporter